MTAMPSFANFSAAGSRSGHPERQSEAGENVFDLIERFTSEVLGGEHLALRALHQVSECTNVRVLQAVGRTKEKIKLFDGLGNNSRETRIDFRLRSPSAFLPPVPERAEVA